MAVSRVGLVCEMCGTAIKTGTRGQVRRFCSGRCQNRSWRLRHADRVAARAREIYASASAEDRAAAAFRARARQRALSRLAARYPGVYQVYYREELERGKDEGGSDG